MKPLKIFTGIKKNVVVTRVTSLVTGISSEMLYPIIPIFLTYVLGAPFICGAVLALISSAAFLILI